MTWLDVLLVILLAVSIYSGYRRGAVLQLMGIVGLALGVVVGVVLAPRVAALASSRTSAVAMVLGTALLAGAIGNMLGTIVGSRLRRRTHETPLRTADAVGGSVLSAVALVLATWFLTLNLVDGPFPSLVKELRESRIVRTLEAALPAPPSLIDRATELLPLLGIGSVDLPGEPAGPVDPPTRAQVRAATAAARGSTVEVVGGGCERGFVNQGTGFVVSPELVVTNAHVIAGTADQRVQLDGAALTASVVAFDPDLDVAVLRVPGLDLPPLPLLQGEAARGDVGAALGYPGGGSLRSDDAAVLDVIRPPGVDIYGEGEVRRRIYELQTTIERGNSGGPFVLASGEVAGLVFASSADRDDVGYAIVTGAFEPIVQRARLLTAPVDTGPCSIAVSSSGSS
ncbi:MAG: MarP family serine protease [Actinobacteria bacterium]|nr:MarP family serine protease [Actinomycetota bacterium]